MDEDEFEDMYADELELVDEFHGSPHYPTGRVLNKRSDSVENDTPFSGSSKRSCGHLDDPPGSTTPTIESVRKKLKLGGEAEHSTGSPKSPGKLIIDERDLIEAGPSGLCSVPEDHAASSDYLDTLDPVFTEPSSYVMSCPVRGRGNRLAFLGLRDENWADEEEELHNRSKHHGNLLSKPFWDLWTEAKNELERRESPPVRTTEMRNEALENLPEDVILESESDSGDSRGGLPSTLWVEKYRPKRYVELLSDEGINRTLLHWLKLWDTVVFGRHPKIKPAKEKPQEQQQGNFVKKFLPEICEELDEHKRPQQKVVLLCGPPGLGKTTLAHVISDHAGYNVVEINASDDRSPEVFRTTLEAATQMKAVLGQDPRPNCLVIDEIDGAPAPSVNVLVNMIKSGGQAANAGKRKSKKEPALLLRPVICICNDLYVPALRPLRQIALVLHFPQIQRARLASRLLEIMRRQRMKGDQAAIIALCNKAGNDVRSCLSTLQFIRGRKQQLTMTDIQTFNVGQKDVQLGMLSVLQEIFQRPRNQKKDYGSVSGDITESRTSESIKFSNLVIIAQAFGDYEKLVQGLFDNYLSVNFKDPRFEAAQQGPEWLCFVDELLHISQQTQNYSLYAYLPFVAPAFYSKFAVVPYTKMSLQNTFIEMKMKRNQMSNILTSLCAEMSPQVSCFLTAQTIVLDVLPWLLVILQPSIRPVNAQLFSADEQKQIRQVISVMLAYNLVYQQARNVDGIYQYMLEPNIEEICKLPGITTAPGLTYGIKQLIARELEVEKMRRTDAVPKTSGNVADARTKPPMATTPVAKPLPAIKDEPVKPTRDFFGRVVTKPQDETSSDSHNAVPGQSLQVWYRFKEGYSNAVRRTVRIKDLL